jgi:hypothetical protein
MEEEPPRCCEGCLLEEFKCRGERRRVFTSGAWVCFAALRACNSSRESARGGGGGCSGGAGGVCVSRGGGGEASQVSESASSSESESSECTEGEEAGIVAGG